MTIDEQLKLLEALASQAIPSRREFLRSVAGADEVRGACVAIAPSINQLVVTLNALVEPAPRDGSMAAAPAHVDLLASDAIATLPAARKLALALVDAIDAFEASEFVREARARSAARRLGENTVDPLRFDGVQPESLRKFLREQIVPAILDPKPRY